MRQWSVGWDSPEAQTFGEVASKLLRQKKFYQKGKYGSLVGAWRQLVGEDVACCTRIRSFDRGELVIEVDSSSLLHEINNFMKEALLDGLRQTDAGRDIEMIRFRLASQSFRKPSEDA